MRKILFVLFVLTIASNIIKAQEITQYIVNSKTLNLRSGPGVNFQLLGSFEQGELIKVIDKTNSDWWKVDAKGLQGFVYSNFLKADPFIGWDKLNSTSGTTPDCENITPQYDLNIDNFLKINVGSSTDVIVKLMKIGISDDECIRIVYIRSGDPYNIKNIPEGKYYLKIAYGNDYRKKIEGSTCIVKFMQNAHYEKSSNVLDFYKIRKPNEHIGNNVYESWDVPSFELSLDLIIVKGANKEFKSNDISELEFNK
jgi:hypothetical protein